MTESESTFKSAFCRYYACPSEKFAAACVKRALYPSRRPLAWLLWWFHREYFRPDLRTAEQLGICRSPREFEDELRAYRYENRMSGTFIRTTLGVRMSVGRLIALADAAAPWKTSAAEGGNRTVVNR